jgi:hypothetical protein
MVAAVNRVIAWMFVCDGLRIDRVMRHERCSDDESDSYPRIDYQQLIDPSRACLALVSGISLAVPW